MAEGVSLNDPNLDNKLAKSDELEKMEFKASVSRSVQSIFKADDDFVIWGPASVEIVDKEGDKISAEALDNALPQLLQRASLSLEHSDQLVGRILERFQTEEPVKVEINGQTYERTEFPTAVMDLDDGQPPALYVAGEVFQDTQQSKRARERIEAGELDSYSISGEALVTRKKVDDGMVYDDIVDMDLSAVTLCEEGMNQGAKYAQIEGGVEDKELAGEASADVEKRSEVPVLEHPSMQGVEPDAALSGTQQEAVSKSDMTNEDSESETKSESDGASIEDVLKRLPSEGELATKDDLDDVEQKAVKAVQDSLPDGDLATISAMEELVETTVDEKYNPPAASSEAGEQDATPEGQATDGEGSDYGTDGPEDSETTTGSQAPSQASGEDSQSANTSTTTDKDDELSPAEKLAIEYDMAPSEVRAKFEDTEKGEVPEEFQDGEDDEEDDESEKAECPECGMEDCQCDDEESADVEEKSSNVRSARDKLAEELGVGKDEVNAALTNLLTAEDEEDEEEDEADDVDEETIEDPDGDGEDEMDVVAEEDGGPEDEEEMPPEMEDDDEGDDEEYGKLLERLEEELPGDVWEVVREYVKTDVSKEETFKSPAEILRDSGSSDDSPSEDDVNKAVQEVLEGGAEVKGGSGVPTGPGEDQTEKQYDVDDEAGASDSPALQNFYGA